MTALDKETINNFSEYIRKEGKLAFDSWVDIQRGFWGEATSLSKNGILQFIHQEFTSRYHRYYFNCGDRLDKPDVHREWKYLETNGVNELDSNGKQFSGIEIAQVVFVFVVLVIDWVNEEFEGLQGIGKHPNPKEIKAPKINHWAENNSQTVLIFYFGLKALGYEPGKQEYTSNFARFLHLLTGKEWKNLDNSDFYDKLKVAPDVNDHFPTLLKNLEAVRNHFDAIGYREPLPEIDKQILKTKQEIEIEKSALKRAK